MKDLTNLNAPKLGITCLAGLEYATNLKSLVIGGNQISDLTPLANLRRLKHLYIGGNRISDLTPLRNLRSLQRFGALRNQISDISVLAGLLSLRYLRLAGNPISDTCPLAGLPRLRDVDIEISCPEHVPSPEEDGIQPEDKQPEVDTPQGDGGQTQEDQQDDSDRSDDSTPQDDSGQQDSGGQSQDPPQDDSGQQQQDQNGQQQQQQPDQNNGQQQQQGQVIQQVVNEPPDDNNEPLQSEPQEQEQDPPPLTKETCEDQGGTFTSTDGAQLCLIPESPWDAPSINGHKMFIMDRGTLEHLDPATLEAQLDIWRSESDGSAIYLRSIALLESVLAAIRPDKTQLLPNYPNPFNPETWIPYHLANAGAVVITIYDARGSVVRRLDLGHQREGYYASRSRAAYWDGRNNMGERVASGVYFYQLEAGNISFLRKMVILK